MTKRVDLADLVGGVRAALLQGAIAYGKPQAPLITCGPHCQLCAAYKR
jgi:hypothetical protein